MSNFWWGKISRISYQGIWTFPLTLRSVAKEKDLLELVKALQMDHKPMDEKVTHLLALGVTVTVSSGV